MAQLPTEIAARHPLSAKTRGQQGFSLVQLSLILAIGGIVLATMIPGGTTTSENKKNSITLARMQAIEAATQRFMAANGRRPCPADATLTVSSSANFGKESTDSGICATSSNQHDSISRKLSLDMAVGSNTATMASITGIRIGSHVSVSGIPSDTRVTAIDVNSYEIKLSNSATSAIAGSTDFNFTSMAAGMVPVVTLGLSSEYALDGYGRRMVYMVDSRATSATSCTDMQLTQERGNIEIQSTYAADSSTNIDSTPWALISYGKDGEGAYGPGGTQISTGSSDTDTLNNSFNSSFTGKLVKKDTTATFDDIVWYTKTNKSGISCGIGTKTMIGTNGNTAGGQPSGTLATSVSGSTNPPYGASNTGDTNGTNTESTTAGSGYANEGLSVANGDVNGDGYKDLVTCFTNANKCYVLFGSHDGLGIGGNAIDYNNINGKNGFTITNDLTTSPNTYCDHASAAYPNKNFGKTLAVGDVNGDKIDDILIGGTYPALVYGGPKSDDTSYMRGGGATGYISFTQVPTNGQTVTLNGQAWTMVSSGASGTQSNITAGNLSTTLTTLASNLNASTNTSIQYATYSANLTSSPKRLEITAKISGTGTHSGGIQSFAYSTNITGATAAGTHLTGGTLASTAVPWSSLTNFNLNLSSLDGVRGQIFWGGSTAPAGALAIGNVNGDTIDDTSTGYKVNDIVFANGSQVITPSAYYGPSRWMGYGSLTSRNITNAVNIVFGVYSTSPVYANLAYSNLWKPTSPACLDMWASNIAPSGMTLSDASFSSSRGWHGEYPVIIDNSDETYIQGPKGYNSLAIGDYNGDTFDDIIWGNPTLTYTLFGWTLAANSGNIVILFGRNSEWGIDNNINKHIYNQASVLGTAPYNTDPYGAPYAMGDDGWPEGGQNPSRNAGYYGSGLTNNSYEYSSNFGCTASGIYKQCGYTRAMRITSQSAKYFGGAVAVGDVNNDGYKDIVTTNTNSLYIIPGSNVAHTFAYPYWNQSFANATSVCSHSDTPCYQFDFSYATYDTAGAKELYGYTVATPYTSPTSSNSYTSQRIVINKIDADDSADILLTSLASGNKGTTNLLKVRSRALASNASMSASALTLNNVSDVGMFSSIIGPGIAKGNYPYASDPVNNYIQLASTTRSALTTGQNEYFITPLQSIDGPATNSYAMATTIGDFDGDGANEIIIGASNYQTNSSACSVGSGLACGKVYMLRGHKNTKWGPYIGCNTANYCAYLPMSLKNLD